MTDTISLEQWNRTVLQRQHLIDRVDEDAIEVIDRCVGLQAQDPQAVFYALASRIVDFDPADLDDLLTSREVVRMALLRGTLFVMDGLDARWMRALLAPVLAAGTRSHARHLAAAQPDEVAEIGARIVTDAAEPITVAALRKGLARHWPDEPPTAMAAVVRGLVPLVQTPPRGLWRRSGTPRYALLDDWIGPGDPAVTGDDAVRDLIKMYLRGYGPASVSGVQAWSGLTGLGPIMADMEADWELTAMTGPQGQTLYDLDGLGLADPGSSVPVRFIAPYDTVVHAAGDRVRVADPEVYARTVTRNGISPGFVLVDGRLAATWQLDGTEVRLRELRDLTPSERRECEREAGALTRLGAATAG
ncbi:winged helix DNA-binding domain-containing protein [Gordonia shandongensis]|uniref:winged helix DNA-binding domain-containing protein n=1 Tax=Gordonia shandongensis TaxID=376351 RepID=UPI00047CA584|nr:winged helix DNA-binding domain-containing protein [Gordonia shandongensis]